ncbi:MAG TPA: hypothetical protein VHB45_00235 [Alloacidobacterium sp.]|nr:hypothetical protein [Alloacidobacterium sp.]
MKRKAVCIGILALPLLLSSLLAAQSTSRPALHHRGDPDTMDRPVVVRQRRTNSLIPEDASGEYMLGRSGEVVQITIQFGDLSGYISRLGDGESDSGTPLTFFFDKTAMQGQELSFTTRQVHGIWYSFQGTIARGPGKTREEDGYYLLTGDLIEHDAAQNTEQRRSVSLKSGRQFE